MNTDKVLVKDVYEVEYSEKVPVWLYTDPDTGKQYWTMQDPKQENWEEI